MGNNLGYYTKSFIKELNEMENNLRWAPSKDFIETFSNRHLSAMRMVDLDDPKVKYFEGYSGNQQDNYRLASCFALYNNWDDIDKADEILDKVPLSYWVDFYNAINSGDHNDIHKAIESLQDVRSNMDLLE